LTRGGDCREEGELRKRGGWIGRRRCTEGKGRKLTVGKVSIKIYGEERTRVAGRRKGGHIDNAGTEFRGEKG